MVATGDTAAGSFLVTEFLEFGGRFDQAAMGRELARMHKATPNVRPPSPLLHCFRFSFCEG